MIKLIRKKNVKKIIHQQLPTFILHLDEFKSKFEKNKILAMPYIDFFFRNGSFNDLYNLLNEPSLLNASNRDTYTWEEMKQYHFQSLSGFKWFQLHNAYCTSECTLSWVIISNIISKNKTISSRLIGYAGVKEDDTFHIDVPASNLYLNIIEEYQKRGIGTKFSQEFINWWKKMFPNGMLQWVSRFDNLGSQNLALKSGFIYKRKVNLECEYYIYELHRN